MPLKQHTHNLTRKSSRHANGAHLIGHVFRRLLASMPIRLVVILLGRLLPLLQSTAVPECSCFSPRAVLPLAHSQRPPCRPWRARQKTRPSSPALPVRLRSAACVCSTFCSSRCRATSATSTRTRTRALAITRTPLRRACKVHECSHPPSRCMSRAGSKPPVSPMCTCAMCWVEQLRLLPGAAFYPLVLGSAWYGHH